MAVKKGDKVKVEYTGKLNDGRVFDKTGSEKPMEFTVGGGEIIPGFDNAVEGMELNEEKTVTIQSDEAYGGRKDELVKEFPKDILPPEPKPEKGARLVLKTQDGQMVPATIVDLTESNVTLDLNPPLAGEDLTFDIKVVGVEQ